MKLFSYLSVFAIIVFTSFKLKDGTQKVKDYFSIPGPVAFNKMSFNLSWSSHPGDNYYKQEYIPANEKSETFNKMIMIEAVVGEMPVEDALKAKTDELAQMKRSDPMINYQVIKNPGTGEYLLDFIISQTTGGKQSIVEWNAYRYTNLSTKSNKKGVLLFAYSKRGYGSSVPGFLKSLKTERSNDINSFAAFKIPGVKITE